MQQVQVQAAFQPTELLTKQPSSGLLQPNKIVEVKQLEAFIQEEQRQQQQQQQQQQLLQEQQQQIADDQGDKGQDEEQANKKDYDAVIAADNGKEVEKPVIAEEKPDHVQESLPSETKEVTEIAAMTNTSFTEGKAIEESLHLSILEKPTADNKPIEVAVEPKDKATAASLVADPAAVASMTLKIDNTSSSDSKLDEQSNSTDMIEQTAADQSIPLIAQIISNDSQAADVANLVENNTTISSQQINNNRPASTTVGSSSSSNSNGNGSSSVNDKQQPLPSASTVSSQSSSCLDNLKFTDFQAKMIAKLQKNASSLSTTTTTSSNNTSDDSNNNSVTASAATAVVTALTGNNNNGNKDNVFKQLVQRIKSLETNQLIVEVYLAQLSDYLKSLRQDALMEKGAVALIKNLTNQGLILLQNTPSNNSSKSMNGGSSNQQQLLIVARANDSSTSAIEDETIIKAGESQEDNSQRVVRKKVLSLVKELRTGNVSLVSIIINVVSSVGGYTWQIVKVAIYPSSHQTVTEDNGLDAILVAFFSWLDDHWIECLLAIFVYILSMMMMVCMGMMVFVLIIMLIWNSNHKK